MSIQLTELAANLSNRAAAGVSLPDYHANDLVNGVYDCVGTLFRNIMPAIRQDDSFAPFRQRGKPHLEVVDPDPSICVKVLSAQATI